MIVGPVNFILTVMQSESWCACISSREHKSLVQLQICICTVHDLSHIPSFFSTEYPCQAPLIWGCCTDTHCQPGAVQPVSRHTKPGPGSLARRIWLSLGDGILLVLHPVVEASPELQEQHRVSTDDMQLLAKTG